MPRIKLLVSFAGDLDGHDSPGAGEEIDVSQSLADSLCDGERAERVEGVDGRSRVQKARGRNVEHAVSRPPENRQADGTGSSE